MLKSRYACFDVFDTLVARQVMAPSDVFRLVYRRLVEDSVLDTELVSEDAFVAARRRAETLALSGQEECSLAEIWQRLSGELQLRNVGQDWKYELACENSLLIPIQAGIKRVEQARISGFNCVFISDTYLPSSFVSKILKDLGILQPQDSLYVSSEVRATKRSGTLYQYIMKQKQGSPRQFKMLGDNLHSDVRVPKSLGWEAHQANFVAPNNYELAAAKQTALHRLERSFLSGTIRGERIKTDPEGLESIVNNFLGPASMLWALWVILSARERGLERLYFMARDAYLAHICAQVIVGEAKSEIDCRYLYVSRKTLSLAAVTEVTREQLAWVLRPWDRPTWSVLLRRLDINDISQFPQIEELVDLGGVDETLAADAVDIAFDAFACGHLRSHIIETANERKRSLVQYLHQESFFQAGKSAIVDVGWHLSAQKSLRKIADKIDLSGLYLCLRETRAPVSETGPASSMLGQPASDSSHENSLPMVARLPTLTEHLFGLAPHGTVHCYEWEGGGVIPRTQSMGVDEIETRKKISSLVERYAKKYAQLFVEVYVSRESCATAFRQITDTFFGAPPRGGLAELARAVNLSSDPDNLSTEPLAAPFTLCEAVGFALPVSIGLKRPRRPWPAGSIAISSTLQRSIIKSRCAIDKLRRKY